MQYRSYGKDGPLVSRLGFGAMRLPTRPKRAWASPQDRTAPGTVTVHGP